MGLPTDLTFFARALQGVLVGSLPGPEVGAPKSWVRVLRVKKLLEMNSLSVTSLSSPGLCRESWLGPCLDLRWVPLRAG